MDSPLDTLKERVDHPETFRSFLCVAGGFNHQMT